MNPEDDTAFAQMAAGWVLGALPPEEAQRFAAHLAHCPACGAEVASLQQAVGAMADAVVPPAEPPPGLGARLMATVRDEAELFRAAAAHDPDRHDTRRPRRRRLQAALLAVIAVSLIVSGTILGGRLTEAEDDRVQARTFPGIVTLAAGGPEASAVIRVGGDETTLLLSDVEAPPEDQIYQAWLQQPRSRPVATGALFSVGPSGDTTVRLPTLRGARRMIVTTEPARGSTTPTLPAVVIVDLPRTR